MIGYIILLIIAAIFLLIYWRLTKNYKIAEMLISELKDKAQLGKLNKVKMKVKAYEPDVIYSSPATVSIYIFNQGFLFFQGKDEIEYTITWLYFDRSDKMFFKNCQSRGRIEATYEDYEKTTYKVIQTTMLFPFFTGKSHMTYDFIKIYNAFNIA